MEGALHFIGSHRVSPHNLSHCLQQHRNGVVQVSKRPLVLSSSLRRSHACIRRLDRYLLYVHCLCLHCRPQPYGFACSARPNEHQCHLMIDECGLQLLPRGEKHRRDTRQLESPAFGERTTAQFVFAASVRTADSNAAHAEPSEGGLMRRQQRAHCCGMRPRDVSDYAQAQPPPWRQLAAAPQHPCAPLDRWVDMVATPLP